MTLEELAREISHAKGGYYEQALSDLERIVLQYQPAPQFPEFKQGWWARIKVFVRSVWHGIG